MTVAVRIAQAAPSDCGSTEVRRGWLFTCIPHDCNHAGGLGPVSVTCSSFSTNSNILSGSVAMRHCWYCSHKDIRGNEDGSSQRLGTIDDWQPVWRNKKRQMIQCMGLCHGRHGGLTSNGVQIYGVFERSAALRRAFAEGESLVSTSCGELDDGPIARSAWRTWMSCCLYCAHPSQIQQCNWSLILVDQGKHRSTDCERRCVIFLQGGMIRARKVVIM
jgi:hypothetical protein